MTIKQLYNQQLSELQQIKQLKLPEFDYAAAQILMRSIEDEHAIMEVVGILIMQTALDFHRQIDDQTIINNDTKQLEILAGDFLQAKFYDCFIQVNKVYQLETLSQAIQQIYELQTALNQHEQLNLEIFYQYFVKIETLLLSQYLSLQPTNYLTPIEQDNYLIYKLDKYIQHFPAYLPKIAQPFISQLLHILTGA